MYQLTMSQVRQLRRKKLVVAGRGATENKYRIND